MNRAAQGGQGAEALVQVAQWCWSRRSSWNWRSWRWRGRRSSRCGGIAGLGAATLAVVGVVGATLVAAVADATSSTAQMRVLSYRPGFGRSGTTTGETGGETE